MRLGRKSRLLSGPEKAIATTVFGLTLPDWNRILIDDGLGYDDRPYTLDGPPGFYILHVGPVCYPNCASTIVWMGSRIDATFVHEMTHVWQYAHNSFVKLSSLWGQTVGDGYSYTLGSDWDAYNVEQQASIVEDWYVGGMLTTASAFPYIRDTLRAIPAARFVWL